MNKHSIQDFNCEREGRRLTFIILWRLSDWGLYKRRHEALTRELAQRDDIEKVVHVEYVNIKAIPFLIMRWFREKDKSLRDVYACHIKKAIFPRPIGVRNSKKLYLYSILLLSPGKESRLKTLSTIIRRAQCRILNRYLSNSEGERVLLVYPPSDDIWESVRLIEHDLLIADLVDDNANRGSDSAKKKKAREDYERIFPRCSGIFATSPVFNKLYSGYVKSEITYLPNGVDMGDFHQGLRKDAVWNIDNKTAGYIGMMNHEADTELLEYAVAANPDTIFIIIGYATAERLEDIRRIGERYKNFRYLGAKAHSEIPALMERCDVLLNIKKDDESTAGGESIKNYEYLATGKPIVTTPVPPANRFSDIMYVAKDKFQFSELLKKALKEDNAELREKRINAAWENSWTKRVDVILDQVSMLMCRGPEAIGGRERIATDEAGKRNADMELSEV